MKSEQYVTPTYNSPGRNIGLQYCDTVIVFISSGEFANDRISGQGEMQYADGSVYKGQWMDNQVSHLQLKNKIDFFTWDTLK